MRGGKGGGGKIKINFTPPLRKINSLWVGGGVGKGKGGEGKEERRLLITPSLSNDFVSSRPEMKGGWGGTWLGGKRKRRSRGGRGRSVSLISFSYNDWNNAQKGRSQRAEGRGRRRKGGRMLSIRFSIPISLQNSCE